MRTFSAWLIGVSVTVFLIVALGDHPTMIWVRHKTVQLQANQHVVTFGVTPVVPEWPEGTLITKESIQQLIDERIEEKWLPILKPNETNPFRD